jgi:hypothetical protein
LQDWMLHEWVYYRISEKFHWSFNSSLAFVLRHCGCVRFSMPHRLGTRICKRSELKCISEMQTYFIINVTFYKKSS